MKSSGKILIKWFSCTTLVLSAVVAPATEIVPGKPIDYAPYAFYPKRWSEKKVSTMMVPWKGEHLVFLTTSAELDHKVMTSLIDQLDAGWTLYEDLTGHGPNPHRMIGDHAPIAALPRSDLSCGVGCGYVGATGIELGKFYSADYKLLMSDPVAVPHYMFYEMGRNFYTFGERHSLFVTGFAVFMRYVCMDSLECNDIEPRIRAIIEQAESVYTTSEVSFMGAFTNFGGAGEKGHRLKQPNGKPLIPSDQPVMYASAMLKLWKDHGGNEWLTRFYKHLATCPPVKPSTPESGRQQAWNWYVAASCAAGRDLSDVFADRWRFPMTPAVRKQCAEIDWRAEGLNAGAIFDQLLEASPQRSTILK